MSPVKFIGFLTQNQDDDQDFVFTETILFEDGCVEKQLTLTFTSEFFFCLFVSFNYVLILVLTFHS